MDRRRQRGVSLLEAAFGVSIVASLLAIVVPTFIRSLHSSKTNEAVANLAELHERTTTYFSAAHSDGTLARRWCLPEAAGPTPRYPVSSPIRFDFLGEDVPGSPTWRALSFSPQRTRFRYSIVPESSGCGVRRPEHEVVVTYVAEADLDLDGELSSFERAASVSSDGVLVPEGALRVDKPVE